MIAIAPGFSYIAKKLSDMAQILKYVLNQIGQLHTKNQNLYSLRVGQQIFALVKGSFEPLKIRIFY